MEMKQKIINARVTFRNSPIHILEKFTIKDVNTKVFKRNPLAPFNNSNL